MLKEILTAGNTSRLEEEKGGDFSNVEALSPEKPPNKSLLHHPEAECEAIHKSDFILQALSSSIKSSQRLSPKQYKVICLETNTQSEC